MSKKNSVSSKNPPKINIGDIGLSTTDHFLSRFLRWGMTLYSKIRGKKITVRYSHAFLFIEVWDQLHVAEAVRKGVVIRPFKHAYPDPAMSRVKIRKPVKPYTKDEQEKLCKVCLKAVMVPHRYDFLDLLAQIWLLITGTWIGRRGRAAEGKYYCSEFVATMTNKVRKTFKRPERTNPYDVIINENFEDKFDYARA